MCNLTWYGEPLEHFAAGSTEPFVASVLAALVRLRRPSRILELGTFEGRTTHALAEASEGGVTTVDINRRWKTLPETARFVEMDATLFLTQAEDAAYDFVFVDDDHTKEHVALELELLIDGGVVAPGGLIVLHDVIGPFGLGDLVRERGGFIIELPLLHAAGGLGVIEVPA